METTQNTGLYSYRSLEEESARILSEWIKENNIPNPVPASDLHCTVVFSTTNIPDYVPDANQLIVKPSTYKIQMLGPALVLSFKSAQLQEHWDIAKSMGGTFKFPRYIPHITLSYQVPIDFEIDDLKPLYIPLMFNPEVAGPTVENWTSGMGLDRKQQTTVENHESRVTSTIQTAPVINITRSTNNFMNAFGLPSELIEAARLTLEVEDEPIDEDEVNEDALSMLDIPPVDEPEAKLSGKKEEVIINPEYQYTPSIRNYRY